MAEATHPSRVPVRLVPYEHEWVGRFEREERAMRSVLGERVVDVQHFGSTSVPGLTAKPTIDILLGARDFPWRRSSDAALATVGYRLHMENETTWRVYVKAWQDEVRGYHLHVVEFEGEHWQRHLLFRDYLREHPAEAARYGRLKERLAIATRGERRAYQNGKHDFIDSIMRRAEAWAGSARPAKGSEGE